MKRGWPADFPIVQFPNPPLIVALLADLAGRLTSGKAHSYALAVFYIALAIWAYEELRRGDNWFRRTLGVAFSIYIFVQLARALRT
jgi:hypothetical protein